MPILANPRYQGFTPRRVVSLTPSITDSLYSLGLGDRLVGVTDYCPAPPVGQSCVRVGGPKTLRVEDILHLAPDLVLANREENSRSDILALSRAALQVWLSFPKTVAASLSDLSVMAHLFQSDEAQARVNALKTRLRQARLIAAPLPSMRCFVPIWMDVQNQPPWWMTFNRHTYCHDLLRVFKLENVFAARRRRYPFLADLGMAADETPGRRDTRYPRVTVEEVQAAQPELILLPSEPYPFGAAEIDTIKSCFAGVPAVKNHRVYLMDGTLLTWYGTRLELALQTLPGMLGMEGK